MAFIKIWNYFVLKHSFNKNHITEHCHLLWQVNLTGGSALWLVYQEYCYSWWSVEIWITPACFPSQGGFIAMIPQFGQSPFPFSFLSLWFTLMDTQGWSLERISGCCWLVLSCEHLMNNCTVCQVILKGIPVGLGVLPSASSLHFEGSLILTISAIQLLPGSGRISGFRCWAGNVLLGDTAGMEGSWDRQDRESGHSLIIPRTHTQRWDTHFFSPLSLLLYFIFFLRLSVTINMRKCSKLI